MAPNTFPCVTKVSIEVLVRGPLLNTIQFTHNVAVIKTDTTCSGQHKIPERHFGCTKNLRHSDYYT